jgi:hypothetical protein
MNGADVGPLRMAFMPTGGVNPETWSSGSLQEPSVLTRVARCARPRPC